MAKKGKRLPPRYTSGPKKGQFRRRRKASAAKPRRAKTTRATTKRRATKRRTTKRRATTRAASTRSTNVAKKKSSGKRTRRRSRRRMSFGSVAKELLPMGLATTTGLVVPGLAAGAILPEGTHRGWHYALEVGLIGVGMFGLSRLKNGGRAAIALGAGGVAGLALQAFVTEAPEQARRVGLTSTGPVNAGPAPQLAGTVGTVRQRVGTVRHRVGTVRERAA